MKTDTKKTASKKACTKRTCCAKKTDAPKAKKVALKAVTFTLRADAGKKVYVAGCFNRWNPADKLMTDKKNNGVYSVSVKLAPGSYQYKFVVDGIWCCDPECADSVQNELGTLNNVITVK